MPDGRAVVGLLTGPAADGTGCDLRVPLAPGEPTSRRTVRDGDAVTHRPGPLSPRTVRTAGGAASLVVLPESAGAGGAKVLELPLSPVRTFDRTLDLPDTVPDLPAELRRRDAADEPRPGEKLRITRWTLRVGAWGDALLDPDTAEALAASLGGGVHAVVAVPHPDRLTGDDEESGAAFLDTLAHFDPLGDSGDRPAALAELPAPLAPDPARVAALASRFALPLCSRD